MKEKLLGGIQAGILISVGCSVFLACENRYVGAVLFTVALLCICMKGYYLFTGKVGLLAEKCGKDELELLLWCLIGNAAATIVCGRLVAYAVPADVEAAAAMSASKLAQAPLQTFIRALFCGILMYLAVTIYRDKSTPLAIAFCIPVFILSGFEHSIADIFYLSAGGADTVKSVIFILIVIAGNSAGGLLLPLIDRAAGRRK